MWLHAKSKSRNTERRLLGLCISCRFKTRIVKTNNMCKKVHCVKKFYGSQNNNIFELQIIGIRISCPAYVWQYTRICVLIHRTFLNYGLLEDNFWMQAHLTLPIMHCVTWERSAIFNKTEAFSLAVLGLNFFNHNRTKRHLIQAGQPGQR